MLDDKKILITGGTGSLGVDVFSMKNIGLRRPGNGLPPEYFEIILGKKSTKYFKKGELIEL